MKTVGIIGAGAAGLCALRHALTASPNIVPVIWEQSKVVGGTWVYTDNIDKDDHGLPVHSSMYKSLRTNLPKEVMSFPDFPFPAEGDSFIPHAAMLRYLQDYSQNFDLERHIKFEHVVLEVVPSKPGASDTEWIVTVRDLTSDKLTTTLCHALLICNGHYSVPYIPSIDGIENFCGSTMHSHSYREASPYSDQTVAVLGASASGLDISVELCSVAKKVFLCHNLPIPFPAALPSNLEQKAGIVGVKQGTSNTLVLKDGSELEVDALLYCTGYYYTFPFLADSCGVTVEDQQVWPLYRHLIHCDYPTLAFVGIPTKILPFPLFDIQVRYAIACLLGFVRLPSCSDMRSATEQDVKKRAAWGHPSRYYHKMVSDDLLWGYFYDLQDDLRCAKKTALKEGTPWPLAASTDDDVMRLKGIWEIVYLRLVFQVLSFRNYNYRLRKTDHANATSKELRVEETLDGKVTRPFPDMYWCICKRLLPLVCCNFFSFAKFLCKTIYFSFKKNIWSW